MMTEHAPEPWRFDLAGTGRRGDSKIVACDDVIVGRTYDYDQRDARRIVACVNACKEWDTETLEAWAADPTSPLLDNQLAQLQRDLAAARADAARYKAAVAEALRRGMEHAGFDRYQVAGEEPWVQEIAAKLTEPAQ